MGLIVVTIHIGDRKLNFMNGGILRHDLSQDCGDCDAYRGWRPCESDNSAGTVWSRIRCRNERVRCHIKAWRLVGSGRRVGSYDEADLICAPALSAVDRPGRRLAVPTVQVTNRMSNTISAPSRPRKNQSILSACLCPTAIFGSVRRLLRGGVEVLTFRGGFVVGLVGFRALSTWRRAAWAVGPGCRRWRSG